METHETHGPQGLQNDQLPAEDEFEALQRLASQFAVGWLVLANLVGVWLATLLVWPGLGIALGEFSYGRWMPLHLNWQLYGWGALPAVAALLRRFLQPGKRVQRETQVSFVVWSAALAAGGWDWLHGQTSGKLFLDWQGQSRTLLLLAMGVLWGVLAWNGMQRARTPTPLPHADGRTSRVVEFGLLTGLGFVPLLLAWSGGRSVYPPIDPGTGGPTGASLLGSTLVVVLLFALIPWLLRLPHKSAAFAWWPYWSSLAASVVLCVVISGGNSSHEDWRQILGLGSLLAWIPLLHRFWQRFEWNSGSHIWLRAMLFWWSLLVFTGIVLFLQGVLDRVKFGSVLVAHSHLAMAGFLTSLNMVLLLNLSQSGARKPEGLSEPLPFYLWQTGLLGQILSLVSIGYTEVQNGGHSGLGAPDSLPFKVRLAAGILMTAASIRWLTTLSPSNPGVPIQKGAV